MNRVGMMTENITPFGDLCFCLQTIKDIGFECADITLYDYCNCPKLNETFAGDDYEKQALRIKKYADDIGLPLVQGHAPFPVYREGDDEFNAYIDWALKRSIKVAGILGIKNLVIHPCNNWSNERNKTFFEKYLPLAKECGVIICCENMWNWDHEKDCIKPASCSLSDDFKEMIDIINDDNFKACVDVGHAQMFSHIGLSPDKMLETLAERVVCLHLHDNDSVHDLHNNPFTGTINWTSLTDVLKKINYQGDLIIESSPKGDKSWDTLQEFWKDVLNSNLKIQKLLLNKK